MAETLLMLALSPTMEAGTIQKWNFQEGDTIKEGDVLCEVETDKAAMEYESLYNGVLLKIMVPEGGSVKVGEPIAVAGDKGEDISELLVKTLIPEKTAPIQKIETIMESPDQQEKTQVILTSPDTSTHGRIKASPLCRKIAREKNINLALVTGSGPGGRIIKRDIETYLKKLPDQAGPAAVSQSTIRLPMSEMRKVIAKRMTESMHDIPQYYLRVGVHMSTIMDSRKNLNKTSREKISLNAFIIKLVAEALKKHPRINASLEGQEILLHPRADIALAVAVEDGLITPIVRNCGTKSIPRIDEELKDLISRAREKKLDISEFSNSTFTISNLGSYGIVEFTAIINSPNSAILAIGAIVKQPAVNEADEIIIRPVAQLTLSCDHRLIDGAIAAAFLYDLKQIMENPISAFY